MDCYDLDGYYDTDNVLIEEFDKLLVMCYTHDDDCGNVVMGFGQC